MSSVHLPSYPLSCWMPASSAAVGDLRWPSQHCCDHRIPVGEQIVDHLIRIISRKQTKKQIVDHQIMMIVVCMYHTVLRKLEMGLSGTLYLHICVYTLYHRRLWDILTPKWHLNISKHQQFSPNLMRNGRSPCSLSRNWLSQHKWEKNCFILIM